MSSPNVERRLSLLTAWMVGTIVALMVFVISVMGIVWYQAYRTGQSASDLKALTAQTHGALCTLKADQQRRYDSGNQYLEEHPQGLVSSHGEVIISAALLRQSINAQAATLKALQGLDCS